MRAQPSRTRRRLQRIDPTKPQFISWAAVKGQFGADYKRMNKFKEVSAWPCAKSWPATRTLGSTPTTGPHAQEQPATGPAAAVLLPHSRV